MCLHARLRHIAIVHCLVFLEGCSAASAHNPFSKTDLHSCMDGLDALTSSANR
jgi:hypothetical protein